MALIKATGVDLSHRLSTFGGGASTLVDALLAAGYKKLSVLDISRAAH